MSSTSHREETAPELPVGLARFNSLARSTARSTLHEVCASSSWVDALLAARPYTALDRLLAVSDAATARLTARDLAEAMAAHPPIGRLEPGDLASAREQRGMATTSDALKAEMLELNLAYQKRFGHVFLICATGLTGEQMRDALRTRMTHPAERERETVRGELGRINRVRLTRLAEEVRV